MDLRGKTVVLRVDWNLSISGNERSHEEIEDISKIYETLGTIKKFFKDGARCVHILTHQGRKGSSAFVSTKIHADILRSKLSDSGIPVVYTGDFSDFYPNIARFFKDCQSGEVYVWDNVRKLDEETDSFKDVKRDDLRGETKKRIGDIELFNVIRQFCKPEDTVYVNDAFATHHRINHLTIGPLPRALKDAGYDFRFGPTFEAEMKKADKLKVMMGKYPTNLVFGGAKIKDYVMIIPSILERFKKAEVFTSGPLALSFVQHALNIEIGRKNEELFKEIVGNGLSNDIARIYERYKKRIHLPSTFMVIDSGVNVEGGNEVEREIENLKGSFVVDLGHQTISEYIGIMRGRGKAVNIINGGCGFHQEGFINGTYEMFKHLKSSGSYVATIGGDASATWHKFGKKLGKPHMQSTAGKAFLSAIVDEKLPLVEFMR